MPRAKPSAARTNRIMAQAVAAQQRDVAGQVSAVVELADTINGAIPGGVAETLQSRLDTINERLSELESIP
ncbi:hypothetical protein [Novosphingobium sp. UBA1939]|uniref:hypothetical protein n=1 Tax=Novosphingobium sp. UBA1939 TaxID=1946982 RepID=UPI0025DB7E11|nr:hypothetical protein [Novosphingobium sp. UBA1939]